MQCGEQQTEPTHSLARSIFTHLGTIGGSHDELLALRAPQVSCWCLYMGIVQESETHDPMINRNG